MIAGTAPAIASLRGSRLDRRPDNVPSIAKLDLFLAARERVPAVVNSVGTHRIEQIGIVGAKVVFERFAIHPIVGLRIKKFWNQRTQGLRQ